MDVAAPATLAIDHVESVVVPRTTICDHLLVSASALDAQFGLQFAFCLGSRSISLYPTYRPVVEPSLIVVCKPRLTTVYLDLPAFSRILLASLFVSVSICLCCLFRISQILPCLARSHSAHSLARPRASSSSSSYVSSVPKQPFPEFLQLELRLLIGSRLHRSCFKRMLSASVQSSLLPRPLPQSFYTYSYTPPIEYLRHLHS